MDLAYRSVSYRLILNANRRHLHWNKRLVETLAPQGAG
jgi:hypothetical protein